MKLLIHSQISPVALLEVWEWIRSFIPHFLTDVIEFEKKNSEHSAPDIHVTPVEELIKQVSTDENDILA